jgi:hypothetical protein
MAFDASRSMYLQGQGQFAQNHREPFLHDLLLYIEKNFVNFQLVSTHSKDSWLLESLEVTHPLVIVVCRDALLKKDYLRSFVEHHDHIEWISGTSYELDRMLNLADKHPDTKFLFLTSVEFINREVSAVHTRPNLHCITIGGDIFVNNVDFYGKSLVLDKQPADKFVLCLNNYPRPHRIAAVLYLLQSGLNQYCDISFLSQSNREQLDDVVKYNTSCLDWLYHQDQELQSALYQQVDSLKTYPFFVDDINKVVIIDNFTEQLVPRYRKATVEIITESTCFEPTLNFTEKFSNSVYGATLPILVANQGSVAYARSLGFDMFDDIIDHSYDNEPNPFYRIKQAIDLNRDLLSDCDLAFDSWIRCRDRFLSNKQVFETEMYRRVDQKRTNELNHYKHSLPKHLTK